MIRTLVGGVALLLATGCSPAFIAGIAIAAWPQGGGGEAVAASSVAPVITPTVVAPRFVSEPLTWVQVGGEYYYEIAVVGSPTPFVSAKGLPSWLALDGAVLRGVPTIVGSTGEITLLATNGVLPVATQVFFIVVADAPLSPQIISSPLDTATVRQEYHYQIQAVGTAPLVFFLRAAPSWLTLQGDTLRGTPLDIGVFAVTIEVRNGVAPVAVQSWTITVTLPELKWDGVEGWDDSNWPL